MLLNPRKDYSTVVLSFRDSEHTVYELHAGSSRACVMSEELTAQHIQLHFVSLKNEACLFQISYKL